MDTAQDGNSERSRILDIVVGALTSFAIAGLFAIDATHPRGVLDGCGYPAIVALSSRFGGRTVIGCAVLTSILTVIAAFLAPDAGISHAGMWANRAFAVVAIWIVGGILLHRLKLEGYIKARSLQLIAHKAAMNEIIHEVLLSNKSLNERIQHITEIGARAIGADKCGVLQSNEMLDRLTVIDIWDAHERRHFSIPDIPVNETPGFRERLEARNVVRADDVLSSPLHQVRLELFRSLGIRAIMAAGPFAYKKRLGSVVFSFDQVHCWSHEECAFAIGTANLVSLLFSSMDAAETLAALDLVAEGIYVNDPEGNVRYANRAARKMARPHEHEARNFPQPDVSLDGEQDLHTVLHDDRELDIQRLRLPTGELLTRINDVTERNAALAERRRLEMRLQQSAKMEAIGQLAGGVAHDFNNILGSILGFAGFLTEDLPEQQPGHRYATRILMACERGKNLVEQILAFASTRSVEHSVVSLGQLLERGRDFLTGQTPENVELIVHAPGEPLMIVGSPIQISQLVTNLCNNARDSFAGRPGIIGVSAGRALADEISQLSGGPENPNERLIGEFEAGCEYCWLRVEDNGPGIPPAILDRVFEPFFTTKGRQRGTGLGLSVAHGVVKSHNAILHLRSSPERGTSFTVYFPLVNRPAATPFPDQIGAVDLRGTERVLIVDDEFDIADTLVIGLERLGYRAVSVNDPVEALGTIAEDPHAFDIVITDQVMPDLRGTELIRKIKQINSRILTVLCTGYSDSTNAGVALAAGADLFIGKPASVAEICGGIRNLMKERR
jgi:signal transduction histidine kinase/ActR/RegA family two-component response regulator